MSFLADSGPFSSKSYFLATPGGEAELSFDHCELGERCHLSHTLDGDWPAQKLQDLGSTLEKLRSMHSVIDTSGPFSVAIERDSFCGP